MPSSLPVARWEITSPSFRPAESVSDACSVMGKIVVSPLLVLHLVTISACLSIQKLISAETAVLVLTIRI